VIQFDNKRFDLKPWDSICDSIQTSAIRVGNRKAHNFASSHLIIASIIYAPNVFIYGTRARRASLSARTVEALLPQMQYNADRCVAGTFEMI